MLNYVEISLFNLPAQTLVNTVNTVGVMGKGIALQFKQLYPEMYEQYRKFCLQGSLVVGKLYVYRTPNKIIVNFPTKRHWREHSQIKFIEDGLQKFVERYADYGISSVAFPQLGCGNGELDWDSQVKPVMEKYLKDLPIPVYIHLYKPQANFVPERLDKNYVLEAQHNIRLVRQQPSADQFWLRFTSKLD